MGTKIVKSIIMEKVPLTKDGFQKLEKELKQLKDVERPAVIEAIATAREHGDLSENAEYSAAREKQSFIEGRIQELEGVISRADIIDVSSLQGPNIKFGATVTLLDEDTEEETVWQIVGEQEANFKEKKIAMVTPIARALVGKKEGDAIDVVTPRGEKVYEVLKVEYK